tara:strand:+ start:330 stop:638 length:309 start_codon:yes stop_codon:yes gene_type:complete
MGKKIIKSDSLKQESLFDISQIEKDVQLETIYKCMLPKLGNNFSQLIAAHILLILKLEGIIGEDLSKADMDMIESIKEKIFTDKKMHKEFLNIVQSLKEEAK